MIFGRSKSLSGCLAAFAAALGLLLGAQSLGAGAALAASLFQGAHAHGHGVQAVADGGHVDLVLSHGSDAAHEHGGDGDLHAAPSGDHVIHLGGEEGARPRSDRHATPAVLAEPLAAVEPGEGAAPRVSTGTLHALSYSRRSVVLRI